MLGAEHGDEWDMGFFLPFLPLLVNCVDFVVKRSVMDVFVPVRDHNNGDEFRILDDPFHIREENIEVTAPSIFLLFQELEYP